MPSQFELDWLKRWAVFSPQAIALKDGDTGREINYLGFYQQSCQTASVLKLQFGISPGDRVAVLATNELEYVILCFATQRLGAILVPINYRLTQREVNHIVSDCKPKLLIYQDEFIQIVENLPLEIKPSHQLSLQGELSFSALTQQIKFRSLPFAASEDSPCMIIYTSGTTGAPKGAVITPKMLFWNSVNTSLRLNLTQNDCTVTFLPFFHTGGWNVLTTPLIHHGGKIVFIKKFDPDKILALCESDHSTILFGVPTTMDLMARSATFKTANLNKIRYAIVGGEPLSIQLIQIWNKRGIAIRQGYGLTEFGPNVFSLNEQDTLRKIGSIGFPNFYVDTRIVDSDGHDLPSGATGELLLRGPMCMTGYWNNPKATAEVIENGWLHTGDLVRKDDEGYHYVVGRKKDMYKSGGENVYPAEIEQVLKNLPGISEAAVIGVFDEKWGEVGKAFIVKETTEIDLQTKTIQDHCAQNLAKFKIPKYFEFMKSLPKGDSGKILKRELFPKR